MAILMQDVNNTNQVLNDVTKRWLPEFEKNYPELRLSYEGEVKNAGTTQKSMMKRIYIRTVRCISFLLSFQFESYSEPLVVLIAIPLALIGVIWGHLIMGLQFTMPSMLGICFFSRHSG